MAGKYLSLLVHFTWLTAGREPWLERNIRDDLYSYIGGIMNNKNTKLISAGGMFDHIHLRFNAVNNQRCRFCKRREGKFFAMDS